MIDTTKTHYYAMHKNSPFRMVVVLEDDECKDVQYGHKYPLDDVTLERELTLKELEYYEDDLNGFIQDWDD